MSLANSAYGSSSSGASGGVGGTSGTTGLTFSGEGVTPVAMPPRSIAIDLTALNRGVAIQRYFDRLFQDLLKPEYAPLLVHQRPPADNVLLFGSSLWKWSDFRMIISPVPTVFLIPLVVGFSGPDTNVLGTFAVTTPYSFLDNGSRYPLGVWVLSRRPGGVDVFIYGGTIFPSAPLSLTYYGLRDSELGAEWVVPPISVLDLDDLFLIVPVADVKVTLTSMILKNLPSLDTKVPGISFPISSKNFYVHPDGIFSWATHDYPRPSGLEEMESRFIIRNIKPEIFQYLMVAHNKIAIDPPKFIERLISVSVMHSNEVLPSVKSKNGLYHTEVRYLRIMTDEVRLSRFIRGDWPMSYRLDLLSLYHFMPSAHIGFDYLVTSHDTFLAFRNFITFLTWVFGDEWSGSFEGDIRKWQTVSPWVETPVWVLHISLEKAISSWILFCHSDASIFRYAGLVTSWGALEDYLESFMLPENLKLTEAAYNRSLALQVVYPNRSCLVPLEVPSIRPPPRFASVEPQSGCASLTQSLGLNLPENTLLVHPSVTEKKRSLESDSGSASSKIARTPAIRYCHANMAFIFGFVMTAKPSGACKDPASMSSCPCGEHFSKNNRPAVIDVIRSIEDIRSKRSEFCEELLSKLRSHQD